MKQIFFILLLFFSIKTNAQEAEQLIQRVNEHLKETGTFLIEVGYSVGNTVSKTSLKQSSKQHFRLAYPTKQGYEKYDYLIETDTTVWFSKGNKQFSRTEKNDASHMHIGNYYKGFPAIENPIIMGMPAPKSLDKIELDSISENYILRIAPAEIEKKDNVESVLHTYSISKENLEITRYIKTIHHSDGSIINHQLDLKLQPISERKFDKITDNYIEKSHYIDPRTLSQMAFMPETPADTVPNFTLKTLAGEIITDKSHENLLLLDFWFVACKPCQEALPHVQKIYEKYESKGLVVLGANVYDTDTALVEKTLKRHQITYPTALEAGFIMEELRMSGVPTILLVNNKGKILWVEVGFEEEKMKELDQLIEKELSK